MSPDQWVSHKQDTSETHASEIGPAQHSFMQEHDSLTHTDTDTDTDTDHGGVVSESDPGFRD